MATGKRNTSTGSRSKKTASRKGTGNRGTSKTASRKKTSVISFKNEVVLWSILAGSILLFISNFGIGGKIGDGASHILFGIFGLMAYVFPVLLFLGTCFVISNHENFFAWIKLVAWILLFLSFCLFLQLLFMGKMKSEVATIGEIYRFAASNRTGGGVLGGIFVNLFVPNFGTVGTYLIDIVVMIISLVLITERSAIIGMRKGGRLVYESAKEDAARYKERQIKRREEQEAKEIKRADKKVEGVALDTSLRKPAKKGTDEISEIKLEQMIDLPEITEEHVIPVTAETPPNPFEAEPISFSGMFLEEEFTPVIESVKPEVTAVTETVVEPEPVVEPESVVTVRETKPLSNKKAQEEENIKMAEQMQSALEDTQPKAYVFPPVNLLKNGSKRNSGDSKQHMTETANKLQQTLKNFGVNVSITNVSCGPSVTRYEIQPEQGVKVSKIVNLADDIKLNLAAADIRIEAPIPGKAAIGIEVPNKENVTVMFRELIESEEFKKASSKIAFAAGKDIGGKAVVSDIAKMPHVLIAGATGSGKSVCINTIIMSILYKAHPDEVKLIMIDPKVVELSVYNGIPHLMIPVVTDPKKAAGALNWAVVEMNERYKKFADYGVRDLKGYNTKVEGISDIDDPDKPKPMPQIVIIVDELADLMMAAPGDVEESICRLAQLARAAGLHLIIATQRPSVNVITGLIKANMPSRVAFAVTSGVDSRTILDMNGAEKLLGKGDMLFFPQNFQKPLRVQGAFVTDDEVSDIVDFLKNENGSAEYSSEVQEKVERAETASATGTDTSGTADDRDSLFREVGRFLIESDKGSIGSIQRRFKVGFNRAARIMDQLEEAGLVGPEEGTKPRKVLMSPEEFEQYIEEYV